MISHPSSNIIQKYTVLAKEGKWRIAYKFGISVPELEALNPTMGLYPKEGNFECSKYFDFRRKEN